MTTGPWISSMIVTLRRVTQVFLPRTHMHVNPITNSTNRPPACPNARARIVVVRKKYFFPAWQPREKLLAERRLNNIFVRPLCTCETSFDLLTPVPNRGRAKANTGLCSSKLLDRVKKLARLIFFIWNDLLLYTCIDVLEEGNCNVSEFYVERAD